MSAIGTQRWSEGFITCTILFCVGPMAILGSIQDGLDGKWQTLGAKALMDGLATMAFVGNGGTKGLQEQVLLSGQPSLLTKWNSSYRR